MRLTTTALLLVCGLVPAFAEGPGPASCPIPAYLSFADNDLSRVAAAAKAGHLNVVVLGSGSSALTGPDGTLASYPARLEVALKRRLPAIEVTVKSVAKARETAASMVQDLAQVLGELKPDLIVWQTGTVDAIRGVGLDDFREVLDRGIETMQANGVDAILLNQQFSPRTEFVIAIGPYADTMKAAAQHYGVPLFDRLSIMRYWNETGEFDLQTASRSNVLAQRVHDCLGRGIASLIIASAHLKSTAANPSQ